MSQVVSGDITDFKCDALITAVNGGGLWYGGIDGALRRKAGDFFHDQARPLIGENDGSAIVTHGNGKTPFGKVVFVCDNLAKPLSDIIYSGLVAARESGAETVSIPAIRTGVMLGQVEKTLDEVSEQYRLGIDRFQKEGNYLDISFVVYDNPELQEKLALINDELCLPDDFVPNRGQSQEL